MAATPHTSTTTAMLAAGIVTSTFDARDLPAAFGRVCGILSDAGLRHVAAGRVALGRYRPAQCTDVIVLRIQSVSNPEPLRLRLEREVRRGTATSTVRLEAGIVTDNIERRLFDLASEVEWLGTKTMIAAPEHLLWLALSSEHQDAMVDAIHLLQTPHIDWDWFVGLGTMIDPVVARRGRYARRRAEATKGSSFSSMMEKRLGGMLEVPRGSGRTRSGEAGLMEKTLTVEPEEIVWNGVTRAETIGVEAAGRRVALADAARAGRWDEVLRVLEADPTLVNVPRLRSKSLYAPLHQAAHHGAPSDVVAKLLGMGAWRSLRTGDGERAADIAARKGHARLVPMLTPVPKRTAAPEPMSAIQNAFHLLIRDRAEKMVDDEGLRLPPVEPLLEYDDARCWFPIPGMYGGFSFRLEVDGTDVRLLSDSWCRVVEGSEQRHVIKPEGCTLIDNGALER